jgi:hypothetical protein
MILPCHASAATPGTHGGRPSPAAPSSVAFAAAGPVTLARSRWPGPAGPVPPARSRRPGPGRLPGGGPAGHRPPDAGYLAHSPHGHRQPHRPRQITISSTPGMGAARCWPGPGMAGHAAGGAGIRAGRGSGRGGDPGGAGIRAGRGIPVKCGSWGEVRIPGGAAIRGGSGMAGPGPAPLGGLSGPGRAQGTDGAGQNLWPGRSPDLGRSRNAAPGTGPGSPLDDSRIITDSK